LKAYWRCQPDPDEFRNNVGRGAVIDHTSDPDLQEKGKQLVQAFCAKTGINLAAFDVLFNDAEREPLLSEINFLFGRKGLGGSSEFHKLLKQSVQAWLQGL
jgi:ribosomal protein S6--L-glutamate ligase